MKQKKHASVKIVVPKYPRHSLEQALRIPKAIMDQNAGKDCSDEDSATFLGIKYNKGPYAVEVSSAVKYGLVERPSPGRLAVSDIAKRVLRPQNEQEELQGLREAVMKAPDISSVYTHYRGENLPDPQFFDNALVDKFGIPKEKVGEFKTIFFDNLNKAKLIEEHNGKRRILDISGELPSAPAADQALKKLNKSVTVGASESCFVMMPFASPLGNYYEKVYKPAIEKAGETCSRRHGNLRCGQDYGSSMVGHKLCQGTSCRTDDSQSERVLRARACSCVEKAGRPRLIQ